MTAPKRSVPLPWLKPALLVGALAPLVSIALRAATGQLGANPIARALNQLGLLTLVFLLASLACTPAKLVFGWTWPARIRRLLGVLAFVLALLHFLTYAVLDQGLDVHALLADIAQRKFILVGFLALLALTPLALTSTDASVRRLGFVWWKRLHRLAYLAGVLGVIHFIWRVKKDKTEPFIYGSILLVLLGVRILDSVRVNLKKSRPRPAA